MTPRPPSGLKVLLMTDLVGSVALQERLGSDAYAELKDQHDSLFESVLASSSGEILEQTGDGYFIVFSNVREALETALTLQHRLHHGDWSHERPKVRIGIHLGEVTPTIDRATGQARYTGVNVSLTARLMDLAAGDQILLSRPVYENGTRSLRAHPPPEAVPAPSLRWRPHGRYRFQGIAEAVHVFEVGAAGIAPFKRPPGGAKARRSRGPALLLSGVAALAVLTLVGVFALTGRESSARAPGPAAATTAPATAAVPTIAVLPFSDLDDASHSGFSAGVHDDILTSLAKLAQLRVISRTSVLSYAGTQQNIREIGAELGATHLVEGSVRRAGDRVRVTVQLIEAATDHHLWAENFDRELKDVFAIQSEIAKRIASSLLAQLSPAEAARLEQAPTLNVEAYDAYNRAREQWREGTRNEADYDAIVAALEAATLLDPGFAEAWSLLSQVNANRIFNADTPDHAYLDAARFAMRQAQRTAPGSTAAYLAEAYYHYWGLRDFDTALQPLVKARLQSPNDVEIMKAEAWILRRKGRFTDSLQLLERAAELDPNDQTLLGNLEQFHSLLTDYERARVYRRRLRALQSEGVEEDPLVLAIENLKRDPGPASQEALAQALRNYPLAKRLENNGGGAENFWFAATIGEMELGFKGFLETWEALEDPHQAHGVVYSGLMYFSYQLGNDPLAHRMAEGCLQGFDEIPPFVFDRTPLLRLVRGLALGILGRPYDWAAEASAADAFVEESNDALLALQTAVDRLLLWARADLEKGTERFFEILHHPEYGDQLPNIVLLGGLTPELLTHPRVQAELAKRPGWEALVVDYVTPVRPIP